MHQTQVVTQTRAHACTAYTAVCAQSLTLNAVQALICGHVFAPARKLTPTHTMTCLQVIGAVRKSVVDNNAIMRPLSAQAANTLEVSAALASVLQLALQTHFVSTHCLAAGDAGANDTSLVQGMHILAGCAAVRARTICTAYA